MVQGCSMVGNGLDNFRVSMTDEAGHLAGGPVEDFVAGGRVHVQTSGAGDDVFLEFGAIVDKRAGSDA